MARRQQPLPGIDPGREPIDIEIPTMPWEQIGGDQNPGTYGGTIATADGNSIELIKIQPVREHVGDREAADVGFPFWTREAYFDASDLDLNDKDVQSALQFVGLDEDALEEMEPTQRALAIAEALLDYGRADEGPAGWSGDIGIPDKVKWWGGVGGAEYLADEDDEFRNDVLGWGAIRTVLEEEIELMIDENAAEGWSTPGDQLSDDLADEGFDPESIVVEANFSDTKAVNGDLLVGPHWAKVLGHQANDLWSDVDTKKLADWLDENGYEYLSKWGGRVPEAEGHAYAEHVIDAVVKEHDLPRETVKEVAKTIDGWQQEIPGSSSGSTYVWAKRAAGGGEVSESGRMTIAAARAELAKHGMSIKKTDGEYRVTVRGERDPEKGYYTDDLADAVATGKHMAGRK